MDLKKFGEFLKKLRKEKGLTQEDLAEYLSVSRRTVSRWETGNNLPDMDILIELADFYQVDLRELINGERSREKMNEELKETVMQVADYSNEEKSIILRRMHILFIIGFLGLTAFLVIKALGLEGTEPYDLIGGLGTGFAHGMLLVGIILTSKYEAKLRKFKRRLMKKGER